MRENKIRIWDKEKNRMYHLIPILFLIDINGKTRMAIDTDETHILLLDELPLFDNNENSRYISLEYTGLKDKQGKEIYEGDIYQDIQNGYKGIIKYINAQFIVEYPEFIYANDTLRNKIRYGYEYTSGEIVGNIYESPELPEEK